MFDPRDADILLGVLGVQASIYIDDHEHSREDRDLYDLEHVNRCWTVLTCTKKITLPQTNPPNSLPPRYQKT